MFRSDRYNPIAGVCSPPEQNDSTSSRPGCSRIVPGLVEMPFDTGVQWLWVVPTNKLNGVSAERTGGPGYVEEY
jgi:hypothetical protein